MPLLLALRFWEAETAAAAKGGGMRAKKLIWIPAEGPKILDQRWLQRVMEPDEMLVIAAALGLELPEFITLYAAAEDGDLLAA